MNACVSSGLMGEQWPNDQKRAIVCRSTYRKAKQRAGGNSVDWETEEATIIKDGLVLTESEARLVLPEMPREQLQDGKVPPFSPGKAGSKRMGSIVSVDDGRVLRIGFDDNVFTKLFDS